MIAMRSRKDSVHIEDECFRAKSVIANSRTIMDWNSTRDPLTLPEGIKWESAKRQALSLPSGLHLYLWQMLHEQQLIFTLHVQFADTTHTSTEESSIGETGGVSRGME